MISQQHKNWQIHYSTLRQDEYSAERDHLHNIHSVIQSHFFIRINSTENLVYNLLMERYIIYHIMIISKTEETDVVKRNQKLLYNRNNSSHTKTHILVKQRLQNFIQHRQMENIFYVLSFTI